MDTDLGRAPDGSGSRASTEPVCAVSAASGFDPSRETYAFTNGWSMQRERDRPFRWLLRDHNDEIVERDQYRHDLIERYRLTVAKHYDPHAIAMEAASAGETRSRLDPKDDSAGPKDIAQPLEGSGQ